MPYGIDKNNLEKDIIFTDRDKKTLANVTKKYSIKSVKSNIDLVENSDIIIFAIKPQESDAVFS